VAQKQEARRTANAIAVPRLFATALAPVVAIASQARSTNESLVTIDGEIRRRASHTRSTNRSRVTNDGAHRECDRDARGGARRRARARRTRLLRRAVQNHRASRSTTISDRDARSAPQTRSTKPPPRHIERDDAAKLHHRTVTPAIRTPSEKCPCTRGTVRGESRAATPHCRCHAMSGGEFAARERPDVRARRGR
jgi:hypothetical protein